MRSNLRSESSEDLRQRVEDRISAWRIVVERVADTETSILAFGRREDQQVVLKVSRTPGNEWRAGEVLDAFDGKGVVRVYDYVDGAMLLERLAPGKSLVSVALNGDDDAATRILAAVIRKMAPRAGVSGVLTVQESAKGFDRYTTGGSMQVPMSLVAEARGVYLRLCDSQSHQRLLHGDLHHDNVLFDIERGWLAIDPKGILGELEYEVGAALRNPFERPELFTDPAVIAKRVECFVRELSLDRTRVLAWGFAQAVLAAIWAVEDGDPVEPDHQWIALAHAIRPMV